MRSVVEHLDLLANVQLSTQEVHVLHAEPETLSLAQATAGSHHDDRPVSLDVSVDDRADAISRPRLDPPERGRRRTNPSGLAGIPRYQLVLDGSRQDRAEVDE